MLTDVAKQIIPTPIWHWLRRVATRAEVRRSSPMIVEPVTGCDSTLSCVVAYNEFGGYCVPRSSLHRPAAQYTLDGDVWEPDTIKLLTSHTGEGDIVHAGAYFGDFLPALSAACTANAKVWAFEPNPESFRCAAITILINNLQNVELTNAALGASEGTAVMLTKDASGISLGGLSKVAIAMGAAPGTTAETVRLVAIDDVVPEDRHVSFIHLDVEGYEMQALAGALKTIRRCRPTLVLETVPNDAWFSDSIVSLGYTVTERIPGNTVLRPQ